MNGLIRRIAVPLTLLICTAIEWAQGQNSLPNWIANLSNKTGLGSERALRLMIALQLCGALFAFLSSGLSRSITWLTGFALAFSGLAELSAILNAPGTAPVAAKVWVAPLLGLAVGGGFLASMMRASALPRTAVRISAFKLFGVIIAVAIAFSVAGRIQLAARDRATTGADGVETVMLNPSEWVGMTLPESGLSKHLPMITPMVLEGTHWIVFYMPSCSRCHEVFQTYFGGPQNHQVIAVEIPIVPGEKIAAGDNLGDIECQDCDRLTMPIGKRWVMTSPTIVKVENGKVTCVSSTDYDRCRTATGVVP